MTEHGSPESRSGSGIPESRAIVFAVSPVAGARRAGRVMARRVLFHA